MTRRKIDDSVRLTRKITIRVSDPFHEKMEKWLSQSNCTSMAELARAIVYKERIIWYHKNVELESTALELAAIQKELNAIGRNINQITRAFHNADAPNQKVSFALKVAEEYKPINLKVEKLLSIVSEISKKWLRE